MPRRKFNELRDRMTPERRARNAEAGRAMLAELALAGLRQAAGMTQTELAGVMGVSQAALSKLEHQDDIQISTLQRYVAALGGTMEFTVTLPKGKVRINQFGEKLEPA